MAHESRPRAAPYASNSEMPEYGAVEGHVPRRRYCIYGHFYLTISEAMPHFTKFLTISSASIRYGFYIILPLVFIITRRARRLYRWSMLISYHTPKNIRYATLSRSGAATTRATRTLASCWLLPRMPGYWRKMIREFLISLL